MTTRLLSLLLFLTGALGAMGQETYDVVTFTPPAGWARDEHPGSMIAFTQTDRPSGAWARIAVYRSTTGTGSVQGDFAAEWDALVVKPLNPGPVSRAGESAGQDGWSVVAGSAQFSFEGKPAAASLITMSKGDRRLSVVVIANSGFFQADVERFIASLGVAAAAPAGRAEAPVALDASADPRIIGRWSRSSSASPNIGNSASWGTAGYVTSRYDFHGDGTYRYTQRSFFMLHTEILIVKEEGTFTANGRALTVFPRSSVMESYAKQNGTDELGTLKTAQRRPLEQVAYAVTFDYSKGMKEWNLVLQANNPTVRDGSFAGGAGFDHAWIFNQRFPGDDLTLPRGK